jgi:hypothetical protein
MIYLIRRLTGFKRALAQMSERAGAILLKSVGPTKNRGRCVKARAGKDFFVLIFCFLLYQDKRSSPCGNEQTNVN